MTARPQTALPLPVAVLLLTLRGLLLWVVIPVSALAWVAMWPVLHGLGVRLSQFLGWVDLNVIAGLERSVLRPLVRQPLRWTPPGQLPTVTHRIRLIDPC